MTKTCSKCGVEYPATAEFFYRGKVRKDGLRNVCKKCQRQFNRDYYQNRQKTLRNRGRDYYQKHQEKRKQYRRKYYKDHKKQMREYGHNHYHNYKEQYQNRALLRDYGSNALDFWNASFVQQAGICPGCGRHQSELNRRLSLDHDHETGEYRGLLCWQCNVKAGSSKKDKGFANFEKPC